MNKPEYVKVDGKLLKINTDFRVALECDAIARDEKIGQFERALAINYKLFGEAGLDCENQNKLTQLAMRYISLGREEKSLKTHSHDNFRLDFEKCKGLIKSSFKFDYNYDPYELEYLHWFDFYNDLENLSNNEFGTCCILNKVINLLNYDTSEVKDDKQRTRINEAKETARQKYCVCEEKELTNEQNESADELYRQLGLI